MPDDAPPVVAQFAQPLPVNRAGAGAAVELPRSVPVELGGRNGSVAWTKSGLSAGANVIVYPPAEVGDEVKVKGRKILESALRPEGRMKLGSLLADMGR